VTGQICGGCGRELTGDAHELVWIDTPLGLTCMHTHTGLCEGAAIGRYREQRVRRISPPQTDLERTRAQLRSGR